MWIVRFALRRPYTIAVSVIMIGILGVISILAMQIDIFPSIDIPVVGVIWQLYGLSAEDMERRVVFPTERAFSTSVNGIERIESQSMFQCGLLRVYLQPGADVSSAIAQMTSVGSTVLRNLPPGMTPPTIIQYDASSLPIAQMTVGSQTLPEEKLVDFGTNVLRVNLFTIPGLSIPLPYGGKSRQINIDVDPQILLSKGLAPSDVVNALQASNLVLPAGSARIGNMDYNISLNSSPKTVDQFNNIPIKVLGNVQTTIGDIGRAADGFAIQTHIVRINGHHSTFLYLLKKADASTLTIINAVKKLLPSLKSITPEGVSLDLAFDQSVFVKDSIFSVLHEALIASVLVSILIFLFLRSWRSVLIVCTSIPLAILTSIIGLRFTGHSINLMTLGGLSLAIGMLVDDATVEIENIHRNRLLGRPLTMSILLGAEQIALPAIMATLSICVVFFPVVFLTGPAKYLFEPMALAVIFAMLASYVLSRSLVPLLAYLLMKNEKVQHHSAKEGSIFNRVQGQYDKLLGVLMQQRKTTIFLTLVFFAISSILPFITGSDFFPQIDAGLMKLHLRAPSGTRIERTEEFVAEAEKEIKEIIPKGEIATINSMVGMPLSFNLAFVATDNVGGMDAEILIALNKGHQPTSEYRKQIRERLGKTLPNCLVYFQPADIVNQVLNFGLTAPIDIQIEGNDINKSFNYAQLLQEKLSHIAGLVDVNLKQVFDYPTLELNIDRIQASRLGLSQRDIANNLLISTASSIMFAPSFYLNPQNNINYFVSVQVAKRSLASIDDLLATPLSGVKPMFSDVSTAKASPQPQRLGNIATLNHGTSLYGISHSNIKRVLNLTGDIEGRDLGSVVSEIDEKVKSLGDLPAGAKISVRGQGQMMKDSFTKMGFGLILAMALVYLLMVILFQSWIDPLIVMIAVPGALVGVSWMLFLTGTTINVESLMGTIMTIGIAASNSILVVTFANEIRVEKGFTALEAALTAGRTRLRPVLMTALAMGLGMLPAALGLGEGGEQNAPLGRAVIGGLLFATLVTLFIIPLAYAILRKSMPTQHLLDQRLKNEESAYQNANDSI